MALASTMVWETRTTGDPANSAGFNSAAAGTDRSQQDAPHVIIDGVVITATVNATTTDLDVTGYVPVAADVGNTIRVAGGTATAGTYEITAIVAGRWRCDRAVGTAGQTAEGRMGGANSDFALVNAVGAAFNKFWVRAGTYTITSATQNVAGGCPLMANGAQVWQGYETVRGDLGTPPVFVASGIATATLLQCGQNEGVSLNLEVDGAGLVAIRGISVNGRAFGYKLTARNCTNGGITYSGSGCLVDCYATGCSGANPAFFQTSQGVALVQGCVARSNTTSGFNQADAIFVDCISASNSGATSDGFAWQTGGQFVNCTAYGNGRDGWRGQNAANSGRVVNCIAEGNAGIGFNALNVNGVVLIRCAAFNNAGGDVGGGVAVYANVDFVTGTSSFFTNAAAGDFSLNTAAGAGGAVRGNGDPTPTFLDGLTANFRDRGAAQSAGAGGGGSGAGGPVIGQVWGGGA